MINGVDIFDADIVKDIVKMAKEEATTKPTYSKLEPLLEIAEQQSLIIDQRNRRNGTELDNVYDTIKEAVGDFPLPTNKMSDESEVNNYLIETGKELAKIELPVISVIKPDTFEL